MLTQKEKNQKKQSHNRKYKTLIKNNFREIEIYLKEKNLQIEKIKELSAKAQSSLNKASNKGVIHKNKAARKTKSLHVLINKLNINK